MAPSENELNTPGVKDDSKGFQIVIETLEFKFLM